jgi:hypothetical protein
MSHYRPAPSRLRRRSSVQLAVATVRSVQRSSNTSSCSLSSGTADRADGSFRCANALS